MTDSPLAKAGLSLADPALLSTEARLQLEVAKLQDRINALELGWIDMGARIQRMAPLLQLADELAEISKLFRQQTN